MNLQTFKRCSWIFAGLLYAACLIAPTARAESLPVPDLTGRVVDEAQIIGSGAQSRLENKLEQFEQETGHQFVVVTLQALRGYTIEEWGTALVNQWGIGRASHHDGVLLVVAPNERELRIEVGQGLEWELTDGLTETIIGSVIVPKFKSGNLEDGITAGADAVIAQLSGQGLELGEARETGQGFSIDPVIVVVLIVLAFFVLAGFNLYRSGMNRDGLGGGFPHDNNGGWGAGRSTTENNDGWGLETRGPRRRDRSWGFSSGSSSRSSSRSSGGFSGGGGRSRGGGASGKW